jgi:hypothetical protein
MAFSHDSIPAVATHSTGWAAGLVAILAETSALFERSPILGFICLGLLGGFAGWTLLIELGKLDGKPAKVHFTTLGRRLVLGFTFGVAGGLIWVDSGEVGSRGLWMLVTGIVAAAPVEMFRAGIDVIIILLKSKSNLGRRQSDEND